jgi:HAD superfamily hydrolase (TIGR01509 family)
MNDKLIIFDCDGTLVDSEFICNRIFAEILTEIGLSISYEETVEQFMGRSMKTCIEQIEKRLNKSIPEDFISNCQSRVFAAFQNELQPIPGIVSALDNIPNPNCVASNSSHKSIRTVLSITGLLPRFAGRLFSANDVEIGKPAPDLFLYAAQKMGFTPENCIVIEDSVPGVQAAISARMQVFGYAGMSEAKMLDAAGAIVFQDMRTLPELLFNN